MSGEVLYFVKSSLDNNKFNQIFRGVSSVLNYR